MHTSRCTAPDYKVHYVKSVIHRVLWIGPDEGSLKHAFLGQGSGGHRKDGGGGRLPSLSLNPPHVSFMKPLCDLCGSRHESYQAHFFASNNRIASNNASNRDGASAVDGVGEETPWHGGDDLDDGCSADGSPDAAGNRLRKQRWSREAYNAYQREYMRRRRALARGH
jgi:hypothetical protein